MATFVRALSGATAGESVKLVAGGTRSSSGSIAHTFIMQGHQDSTQSSDYYPGPPARKLGDHAGGWPAMRPTPSMVAT